MTPQLTKAQARRLKFASEDKLGLARNYEGKGWGEHAFERVMKALTEKGLVRPYVHGGYEITEAGRAAVKELEKT